MSQEGVYSENKMIWWLHREQRLPDAPKQVQLILSDLCNQDCSFCAYRMSGYTSNELFIGDSEPAAFGHNNPKRWIPTQRALSLLDEMKAAGVLSIQFTGGGEPTVHPDHEAIFEKALALGLRCSLVSNGIKWSDRLIRSILPRFDWVRVSIDAGNVDSYARIRRTAPMHWTRAWANVQSLGFNVQQQQTPLELGVGFVVTPESYKEIVEFTEKASTSLAGNCRFTALFSPDDERPFAGIYDEIRGLLLEARQRYESPHFRIHDNFGSRFDDLKQHRPDYGFCSYQYYTSYIGGDLKAYRCCLLAYNKRGLIAGGDLKERKFDEFWSSVERQKDLAALDPRGCERCQFNVKNRNMLYVMGNTESDTVSRHIEWP